MADKRLVENPRGDEEDEDDAVEEVGNEGIRVFP
jgi:hypothetical protein